MYLLINLVKFLNNVQRIFKITDQVFTAFSFVFVKRDVVKINYTTSISLSMSFILPVVLKYKLRLMGWTQYRLWADPKSHMLHL